MRWIRRKWKAADAREWTREDAMAIVLSPLAYIGLAVGVALSMLLIPSGYWILGITILVILLMHWIIDPKLKAVSEDFEKKQKQFLENLEKIERWEESE
ncbi:MAG TPA: hypothetical protein ENN03_06125 [bacterium]|nr:hypothetical protein [bacterium]